MAVEDFEHLLVADRVQRVLVAVGQHRAGFLEETVGDHLFHPLVNALEEVGALATQAELDDAEGALLMGVRAEAGEGLPRLVADLQGMEDALGVLEIDVCVVVGVQELELGLEGVGTFRLQTLVQVAADLRRDGGDIVYAVADGVDV